MPEKTEYAHGTPSWVDLTTTDPAAAQAFYTSVLGWDYEARPTGGGPDYFLARRNGRKVAGLMQQPPEQAQMGIPPNWTTYVAVDDCDAAVAAAAEAGGQVLMPSMDVMTEGRMAVIADPTGAVFGVWQKGDHVGAELVNEHGALCWNEAQTPDVESAAAFYNTLFGWSAQAGDMDDMDGYTMFMLGEEGVAGAMAPPMEGIPPHWSTVFAVDDADAAAAAAQSNGGSVLMPPFDMPIGRLTVLADGQGAAFQAIQLNEPA